MQLLIPEEFVSESRYDSGKLDVRVPMVGDLVNRRTIDRYPFITVDANKLTNFDNAKYPEFAGKYRCMDAGNGVYELQASTVDLLTGRASGATEVLDLQDIRAGCSAYIAGQVIPREEILNNGGMMYQYTKYLISEEPMLESMRDLIRQYQPELEPAEPQGIAISGRDTRDLDMATASLQRPEERELSAELV